MHLQILRVVAPGAAQLRLHVIHAPQTSSCLLVWPPTSVPRSSPTGRSRSGIQRNQIPTLEFSTSASGVSVSGWTWWLMTGYRLWTTSWSIVTPTTATSSGAPWWRRPTPSEYQSQLNERSASWGQSQILMTQKKAFLTFPPSTDKTAVAWGKHLLFFFFFVFAIH